MAEKKGLFSKAKQSVRNLAAWKKTLDVNPKQARIELADFMRRSVGYVTNFPVNFLVGDLSGMEFSFELYKSEKCSFIPSEGLAVAKAETALKEAEENSSFHDFYTSRGQLALAVVEEAKKRRYENLYGNSWETVPDLKGILEDECKESSFAVDGDLDIAVTYVLKTVATDLSAIIDRNKLTLTDFRIGFLKANLGDLVVDLDAGLLALETHYAASQGKQISDIVPLQFSQLGIRSDALTRIAQGHPLLVDWSKTYARQLRSIDERLSLVELISENSRDPESLFGKKSPLHPELLLPEYDLMCSLAVTAVRNLTAFSPDAKEFVADGVVRNIHSIETLAEKYARKIDAILPKKVQPAQSRTFREDLTHVKSIVKSWLDAEQKPAQKILDESIAWADRLVERVKTGFSDSIFGKYDFDFDLSEPVAGKIQPAEYDATTLGNVKQALATFRSLRVDVGKSNLAEVQALSDEKSARSITAAERMHDPSVRSAKMDLLDWFGRYPTVLGGEDAYVGHLLCDDLAAVCESDKSAKHPAYLRNAVYAAAGGKTVEDVWFASEDPFVVALVTAFVTSDQPVRLIADHLPTNIRDAALLLLNYAMLDADAAARAGNDDALANARSRVDVLAGQIRDDLPRAYVKTLDDRVEQIRSGELPEQPKDASLKGQRLSVCDSLWRAALYGTDNEFAAAGRAYELFVDEHPQYGRTLFETTARADHMRTFRERYLARFDSEMQTAARSGVLERYTLSRDRAVILYEALCSDSVDEKLDQYDRLFAQHKKLDKVMQEHKK
ncbi:hypothetical protein COV18_07020 [Candidatus Woesearchaeota archaeon CG10_big_fil_rev_8_21_14_0_10_37_12]|nr:MAG: hypothetical protein COV18_07020 [Candidatus Woesearchaeota archaeon CG10_big_fil_rev_8_21_14_0_10_37_12]